MINAIKIENKDNVVVVIEHIKSGDDINYMDGGKKKSFKSADDVRIYHKVSNKKIAEGDNIIKYAEHIGVASRNIDIGEHVHTHNVLDSRENLKE